MAHAFVGIVKHIHQAPPQIEGEEEGKNEDSDGDSNVVIIERVTDITEDPDEDEDPVESPAEATVHWYRRLRNHRRCDYCIEHGHRSTECTGGNEDVICRGECSGCQELQRRFTHCWCSTIRESLIRGPEEALGPPEDDIVDVEFGIYDPDVDGGLSETEGSNQRAEAMHMAMNNVNADEQDEWLFWGSNSLWGHHDEHLCTEGSSQKVDCFDGKRNDREDVV